MATMTRDKPLFKIGISLDLQILGNFWDNVSTQLHEIYHTASSPIHDIKRVVCVLEL